MSTSPTSPASAGNTSSPAPPRELILASAGSGKTYHLSSCVLGLLAGGAPPGEVLASTFTRKAAGEILERALVRLAEGASDPEKARELGRDAHESLEEPEECRRLLARLLADIHQLNVGTLDAFFVRLARSFFQELGLTPGWTIADEPMEERLRTEAVQAALSGADRAEMVELLRMIHRGDADRRVHGALLEQVDTLLRIHRQLAPDAVDPWSPTFGVTEQLATGGAERTAAELTDRLARFDVPTTQSGTPRKAWLKARDAARVAIAARDWGAAFKHGIGAKVLQGEDSFDGKPIPPEFVDLFVAARALARIELAPALRRESQAMGRLAKLLSDAFEDVQRRVGTYRFEDITYLLGGPDPTGRRKDLHYRLDQRVRHLLLDEFQDTSLEQWGALEPLADEILSGSLLGPDTGPGDKRAGVIVADTKQSIYGWRGARPELVRRVADRHGLPERTMGTSWRSSPVVLDLVADIFRDLPNNAIVDGIGVGPRVASDWMADFTELEAARESPGHVCIHLAPDDGTAAIHPNLLRRSAEIVKDLHDRMPGQTIGVLVRRNRVVGHLMNELRRLGIRASGEGGTSLTDTAPASAILSLLKLADHPRDRVALYHVARTPMGEVVGLRDRKDRDAARDVASSIRIQLLRDGYGSTLAKWVLELAPRCSAREVQRLLQLVELGHRWDERSTLRPTDFARYVAGEPVEDPSSSRVQVMTVHRSKGMEFDVVVLPELYGSLSPKGEGVAIPERDRHTGRVVRVYPRLPRDIRMLFPEVEDSIVEMKAAELRDGLSVLYVALTRAKYALHLILPPEGGSKKHSAGLIREALELQDSRASDGGVLLERGDPRWFEGLEDEAPVEAVSPEKLEELIPAGKGAVRTPLLRPATAGPGRNLARRSPSSFEGGTRVDLSLALRLDAGPALQRGDVVHGWCQEIGWIEDGLPADEVLSAIARERASGMHEDMISGLIADFRSWMGAESVRNVLSRDRFPSDLFTTPRLEVELPFVRRVGDEIQEGFIDRLVLVQSDGRVVRAEILDFKTDNIEAGDEETLAARTEHYRPQIVAYCNVIGEQHGLPENDVGGSLVFLEAGVVERVV